MVGPKLPRGNPNDPEIRAAHAQLPVNFASPKHTTFIKYPCPPLLRGDASLTIHFLAPRHAATRYPSEDHVDHEAVITTASRYNNNELSFFVESQVHPARNTFRDAASTPVMMPRRGDDLARLIAGVR